jgi:AcrR family transcriptional regulator
MPRPRSLTPDRLAAAALAVLDRDGAAGLTMRAVAAELGMSTMALYRYVEDRDQLELLLVEAVLGAVDTSMPTDPEWTDKIKTLVDRVRMEVESHPAVVPLLLRQRHRAVGSLRWSETVAGILRAAGFDGARRVVALRGLLSYVVGALQLEHYGPLSAPGTVTIAGLPRDEFPVMADTGAHARTVSRDDEFRGGLDLLLSGLQAVSPADPGSGGPASA